MVINDVHVRLWPTLWRNDVCSKAEAAASAHSHAQAQTMAARPNVLFGHPQVRRAWSPVFGLRAYSVFVCMCVCVCAHIVYIYVCVCAVYRVYVCECMPIVLKCVQLTRPSLRLFNCMCETTQAFYQPHYFRLVMISLWVKQHRLHCSHFITLPSKWFLS